MYQSKAAFSSVQQSANLAATESASVSALEGHMQSTANTLGYLEVRIQNLIDRVRGPIPVGVTQNAETMGGLIALAERGSASAERLANLVGELEGLL